MTLPMEHDAQLERDDEPVPVTVHLTSAQHARLEQLIERFQTSTPATEPNTIVDAVFLLGLQQAEGSTTPNTEQPA